MAEEEEPFGTTSIPTGSLSVVFEESKLEGMGGIAQQPQTQAIAVYEAAKNEDLDPLVLLNGNLIDVNPQFVVYTVKNGLIRVMHRNSAMRALLRGHHNQTVTDISFFHDGDVLGTVGFSPKTNQSTLIVWRVYERSPEIGSERLLEISSTDLTLSRLVWHPFNPNQFWMTHSTPQNKQVATLVETTRIQTKLTPTPKDPKAPAGAQRQQQHAICQWHSPHCVMENALQLRLDSSQEDGQLVDLCWSGKDARHVLSVHKNGSIVLWDLKGINEDTSSEDEDLVVPRKLFELNEPGVEHSRCLFLPHEQSASTTATTATPLTTCFVTASKHNSTLTVWSAFAQSSGSDAYGPPTPMAPMKLQQICLSPAASSPSSFVLDVCYGPADLTSGAPPSSFLVLASRDTGKLYTFHIAAEWSPSKAPLCVGIDYVVPFQLKHPVYSWSLICGPTQDDDENASSSANSGCGFDMKAFAYQSKAVQQLTITSSMSLPPKTTTARNSLYQVVPLEGPYTETSNYEEDYDVEDIDDNDDDDDDDDDNESDPEPPAPAPSGGGIFPGATNPFANWLGAIAGGPPPPKAEPEVDEEEEEEEEEELPAPPAPTELPMPPGIPTNKDDNFLNPLELLAKSMSGEDTTTSAPAAATSQNKNNNNKASNKKSPRRSRSPKRSQSNKKGNKNTNNSNKSPFPDGKVTILKRTPDAVPAPQLPADSSVVSDPALMAAAGIPMPPAPAVDPTEQIETAVETAVANLLVPTIHKAVHESFSSLARPLHASMDSLNKKGVSVDASDLREALDLESPLKAVFADSLRNVLVPTLQSITGQVLQQVKNSMPKPPPPQPPAPDHSKALGALAQQLVAMTAKMDALTTEVQGLRKTVAEQASAAAASAAQAPVVHHPVAPQQATDPNSALLQTRNEIDAFLLKGKYEDAFTKAVATTTPQMAVYCCARSSLDTVLRGPTTPVLSQPILICLMQQLSAALAGNQSAQELKIELAWLQEIALVMNPSDPSISQHVPKVVGQLVSNVNARMGSEGNNSPFRRPLQMLLQSLRGMQLA